MTSEEPHQDAPKRQPPGIELPIGLLLWALILFLFPRLVAVGFFAIGFNGVALICLLLGVMLLCLEIGKIRRAKS